MVAQEQEEATEAEEEEDAPERIQRGEVPQEELGDHEEERGDAAPDEVRVVPPKPGDEHRGAREAPGDGDVGVRGPRQRPELAPEPREQGRVGREPVDEGGLPARDGPRARQDQGDDREIRDAPEAPGADDAPPEAIREGHPHREPAREPKPDEDGEDVRPAHRPPLRTPPRERMKPGGVERQRHEGVGPIGQADELAQEQARRRRVSEDPVDAPGLGRRKRGRGGEREGYDGEAH